MTTSSQLAQEITLFLNQTDTFFRHDENGQKLLWTLLSAYVSGELLNTDVVVLFATFFVPFMQYLGRHDFGEADDIKEMIDHQHRLYLTQQTPGLVYDLWPTPCGQEEAEQCLSIKERTWTLQKAYALLYYLEFSYLVQQPARAVTLNSFLVLPQRKKDGLAALKIGIMLKQVLASCPEEKLLCRSCSLFYLLGGVLAIGFVLAAAFFSLGLWPVSLAMVLITLVGVYCMYKMETRKEKYRVSNKIYQLFKHNALDEAFSQINVRYKTRLLNKGPVEQLRTQKNVVLSLIKNQRRDYIPFKTLESSVQLALSKAKSLFIGWMWHGPLGEIQKLSHTIAWPIALHGIISVLSQLDVDKGHQQRLSALSYGFCTGN